MTKSLVVDCSMDRRGKIEELLGTIRGFSQYTTMQFRDIKSGYEVGRDIDAVVLSGSKARIVNPSHRDMFKATVDFINRLDLPIFGICYGYQLLCWTLGCAVATLAKPVIDRLEKVRIVEADEIFAGFDKHQIVLLAQSHYDYILKDSLDSAHLVLLADSGSCEVEAIKHKHKPFYGVQFHPERIKINDQTSLEGRKIIENFYKNVVRR